MPNHILLPHLNQFLQDQQFTLHITANFNRPTTFAAGRDKIKTWATARQLQDKPRTSYTYFKGYVANDAGQEGRS